VYAALTGLPLHRLPKKIFMRFYRFLLLVFFISAGTAMAQSKDSTARVTVFSGSLGITNNGISIIPTFSLNKPAAVVLLSWRKNRFSFEPDIRIASNLKRGSAVFWLRYKLINSSKFTLRVGTHPAVNFTNRIVTSGGITSEVVLARRYIASEIVPNYFINKNWTVGFYYLQANGFQKEGPHTTHFITFNTNISHINLGAGFDLQLSPAVYYLKLDDTDGKYFTATANLAKKGVPVVLQSTINKTFTSNIAGNKDFLWNVTLSYYFSKKMARVK
jgi:hypothetical protein